MIYAVHRETPIRQHTRASCIHRGSILLPSRYRGTLHIVQYALSAHYLHFSVFSFTFMLNSGRVSPRNVTCRQTFCTLGHNQDTSSALDRKFLLTCMSYLCIKQETLPVLNNKMQIQKNKKYRKSVQATSLAFVPFSWRGLLF